MLFSRLRGLRALRLLLLWLLLLAAWEAGSGQLHYSVPEEAKHGTFVGRIAQDLGLELAELVPRLFRVASKDRGDLLEVNLQNGILFVNSRIDREALCGRSAECSIHLEVIVDRPLQVFHVDVKVKDINDNPPVFKGSEQRIFIPENRQPGSRFPLEGAADADIGANSLLIYTLSPTDYFSLKVETTDELSKSLSLELRKSLDREETPEHRLILTATDGGKPELEGTVRLQITVLDVNDNTPLFDQAVYRAQLSENAPNATVVVDVNASDLDEGVNKDIEYSFHTDMSAEILSKFHLDPVNGHITVKDNIDFEETKSFEIQVEAADKGTPPIHCTVLIEILDANDNAPELIITSLSLPVREDAPLGTVIALISVTDRDSTVNGQVTCSLTPHVPFKLVSTFKNYYSLVLDSALDRETTPDYKLVVTARDGGSPSLWATASVSVEVADVNDNAPAFAQPEYTVFVKENNPPGAHIFTVSAMDADAQENALVSYSLVERRVGERSLSSFVSVHAESGKVFALQPLDHEELELLQFQVSARDAGVPSLGSNVTLQVFVLDENDNAPALLPHGAVGAGGAVMERVPLSARAGHLVTKVVAEDADSGSNAWLSYHISQSSDSSLFRISVNMGELRTARLVFPTDPVEQRVVVVVQDHGEPPLSPSVTLGVLLSNSAPQVLPDFEDIWAPRAQLPARNLYLVIALVCTSFLFLGCLLFFVCIKLGQSPDCCSQNGCHSSENMRQERTMASSPWMTSATRDVTTVQRLSQIHLYQTPLGLGSGSNSLLLHGK
ncbi:Protocadherin alpha-3 [Lemmus lemmus]